MPMPPNANAIFQDLKTIVVATFAQALANTEWAPEADPLIYELEVNETKLNFDFVLDTFGLQKMKKNIVKKGAVQKQISLFMEEWEDNITVAERDLSTSSGGTVKMQAELRGKSVPRWKDQQVATLLGPGGDAFTKPSFDEVPYFSKQHSMKLGGDNSLANVSNLDDGGGGNPYWFLFDDSLIKPIWLNWKTKPRFDDFGPDSEHARKFHEVMWNIYCDAGFGMGLWHFGYASNQALDETHFDAARKAMTQVPTYASSDGKTQLMGVRPKTLVVGSSNYLAAKKLILSGTINGGDPNPLYNAVKVVNLSMLP